MKLLQFEADAYCRVMSLIGQILARFQLSANPPPGYTMVVTDIVYRSLGVTLNEIEQQLKKLTLPLAQKHFDRMKWTIDHDLASLTVDSITRNLGELSTRIIDELGQRLFLNVPSEQAPLYLQLEPPFGNRVAMEFPQMTEDISEAAKCLSLDRATASIFHLMRVMELAVHRFGDVLGVTFVREKNWQVILDQINAAIRKLDQKDAKTKAYAQAASHLYNVKVAWRNEVMHPKQTYTFEEARAVFENARIFIGDLVTTI
jgi:hypothetical protein